MTGKSDLIPLVLACVHLWRTDQVKLGGKDTYHKAEKIWDSPQEGEEKAEKLGCSRGYIHKVLQQQGLSPKDVIEARLGKVRNQ